MADFGIFLHLIERPLTGMQALAGAVTKTLLVKVRLPVTELKHNFLLFLYWTHKNIQSSQINLLVTYRL